MWRKGSKVPEGADPEVYRRFRLASGDKLRRHYGRANRQSGLSASGSSLAQPQPQAQVFRLIGSFCGCRFFVLGPGSETRISVNILILNYEYPPVGGAAGAASSALAHGLADRGIYVDVVTAGMGASEVEILDGKSGGNASGRGSLHVHRLGTGRSRPHDATMADAAGYIIRAVPAIRKLVATRSYDAVQVFFSLPTGLLLPFAGLGDVPVVVSLRGSDVPGYDPTDRLLQQVHRVLLPVTRWIWRKADRVVTVSDGLGRLALQTDSTLSYEVIPNGVDTDLFRPPADQSRPPSGPIRCVAVGRLIERKGFDNLLRALHLLPRGDYRLEIVGTGRAESELRALTGSLGLSSEVEFTGPLDHAAVAERYRRADIFTLTPEEEAFGNVFAEALAAGLPIVASDVGGIPELVEPGVNGRLIPPRNPNALAGAIRHLGEDLALRDTIGSRNRSKAVENLSWRRMVERYLEIYRELASAGALAPHPSESVLLNS